MELKLIGKLDGCPLFELEEGKYILVNTKTGRHFEMWTWYGQLGRGFDMFEKCGECEDELSALKIIEANKDTIVNHLNRLQRNLDDEIGRGFLKAQKKFFDWIEPNRVFDWYSGKYEDESEGKEQQ